MGNVVHNVLIAMHSVGWVVDLLGLSLCELHKCPITTLCSIPETNTKELKQKNKKEKGTFEGLPDLFHICIFGSKYIQLKNFFILLLLKSKFMFLKKN